MRVIVCGGREYVMDAVDWYFLDALHSADPVLLGRAPRLGPIEVLYHGAADGADSWAALWAETRGVQAIPFPADWQRLGRGAGPIRNGWMLRGEHPIHGQLPPADLVVAHEGGDGTADMVQQARDAGVPVLDLRGQRWLRWTREHVRDLGEFTRHLQAAEAPGTEGWRKAAARAMRATNEAHGGLQIPIAQGHMFRRSDLNNKFVLPPGALYCARDTMLRQGQVELPEGGDGSVLGNPIRYQDLSPEESAGALEQYRAHLRAVYRKSAHVRELIETIGEEHPLLICWCHESKPCHTTVIAEAAQMVRARRTIKAKGHMLPPPELPASFVRSIASARRGLPGSSAAA